MRVTLANMRLSDLPVGSDSRNRCSLAPFRSITGRNQPSTSNFIFGPAKCLRGLIRPEEGCGLAYIDFISQEIAIAAGLSGDGLMARHYGRATPTLVLRRPPNSHLLTPRRKRTASFANAARHWSLVSIMGWGRSGLRVVRRYPVSRGARTYSASSSNLSEILAVA